MAELIIKICPICGNNFSAKRKEQKFCSHVCSTIAITKFDKSGTCEQCGKHFERKQYRNTRDALRFCSRECSFTFRKLNTTDRSCNVLFAECTVCGCWFSTRSKAKTRCSDACDKKHARKQEFERNRNKHDENVKERKCKECGKAFIRAYGNKHRDFCSNLCSHRYWKRIGKSKRRARLKGAACESIDRLKVFERDGWRCQLCGCKVLKSKNGTCNDRAPELDHIVPLALGGNHTTDNVQCSCRRCNGNKAATVQGQLRIW